MIIIIDIIVFIDSKEIVKVAYGEYSQVGSKYHFYMIDEFTNQRFSYVATEIRKSSDYINKVFLFSEDGNLIDIMGVTPKCLKHNKLGGLKRGKKKKEDQITKGITAPTIPTQT